MKTLVQTLVLASLMLIMGTLTFARETTETFSTPVTYDTFDWNGSYVFKTPKRHSFLFLFQEGEEIRGKIDGSDGTSVHVQGSVRGTRAAGLLINGSIRVYFEAEVLNSNLIFQVMYIDQESKTPVKHTAQICTFERLFAQAN